MHLPVKLLLLLCILSYTGHAQQLSGAGKIRQGSMAVASSARFNIRDFGATGDGRTLDTDAINKAIEAARAAGGGTVYFPAGTYLSFSIHLKSNISLFLDQGAVLEGAEPAEGFGGYDPGEPNPSNQYQDWGHSHWHNSLIWGENLENVSILGTGTIFGKGLTRGESQKPGIGNKAIALKLCRNVVIRDITILYGGHFGILATGVDNFTVDNVKMDTNRDGIDVDCCKNVRISNCTINSPWDDAICLKSSYALGYARTTENVTITNCQVSGFDRGTLYDGTYQRNEYHTVPDKEGVTGRIKFGTESNGGFQNITISNCVFEYCRGLALETVDGGLLEDVTITNISMRDIINAPLFLRLGARMRGPEGTPVGKLRRINISNIVVYNANADFASIISGIPGHPIEDIKLSNIQIWYKGGGTKEMAEINPPENEKQYPEPAKMGEMPAYGFFLRHVDGIEFNNVDLHLMEADQRPPFVLHDVKNASLSHVQAEVSKGISTMALNDVENLKLHESLNLPDKQHKKIGEKKF